MEGLRLPSALVQTARDLASESLKAPRLEKRIKRKSLTVRYDRRTSSSIRIHIRVKEEPAATS